MAERKPLSVRTRFEVFKRDEFTCRYCGRSTPDCILEVDHVIPVADGGSNDEMNLVTSCWDCNRGKRDIPLNTVMTGEDPHDKAIELKERERQLREYNAVLSEVLAGREADAQELLNWWCEEVGCAGVPRGHFQWLVNTLDTVPQAFIKKAMSVAIGRDATDGWRYVMVVIRNWREDGKLVGVR